jgi:hypothetical protein
MVADLVGVGRVVEALTNAVGKSLGYVLKPWQIRRVGRAKIDIEATRIREIAAARAGVGSVNTQPVLQRRAFRPESNVPAVVTVGRARTGNATPDDMERTALRVRTAELRRTGNIEGIVWLAERHVRQLGARESVQPDEIRSDWMDQFLKLAENVSDDQIAEIWARILARQVVRNTRKTSLATLDILRLLESHQAIQFQRCVAFTCSFGICFDVWDQNDDSVVLNTNDTDVLALEEIGFLKRNRVNSHIIVFRDFVLGFFFGPGGAELPPKNWMPKVLEYDFIQLSWRGTELASVLVPHYLDVVNGDRRPGPRDAGIFARVGVRRAIIREWAMRMLNRCSFVAIGASIPLMRDVTSGVEPVFTHVFVDKGWRPLPQDKIWSQIDDCEQNKDATIARLRSVSRLIGNR